MATVHCVYIVPSDKTENADFTAAFKDCIADMQDLFYAQLNNGKTFSVSSPIVNVITSSHNSAYFHALDGEGMYHNAIDEVTNNLGFQAGEVYLCYWGTYNATGVNYAPTHVEFIDGEYQFTHFACCNASSSDLYIPLQYLANARSSENILYANSVYAGGTAHELGHAIGGLRDRYNDPNDPGYDSIMGIGQGYNGVWPNVFFYTGDITVMRGKAIFSDTYTDSTGTPFYTYVAGYSSPSASSSLSPSQLPLSFSVSPSLSPSISPSISISPSKSPSKSSSISPSYSPSTSKSPSKSPSISASASPSTSPSLSISPSKSPSLSPSPSIAQQISLKTNYWHIQIETILKTNYWKVERFITSLATNLWRITPFELALQTNYWHIKQPWTNQSKNTSSWINQTLNTSTWTKSTKHSSLWTNRNKL